MLTTSQAIYNNNNNNNDDDEMIKRHTGEMLHYNRKSANINCSAELVRKIYQYIYDNPKSNYHMVEIGIYWQGGAHSIGLCCNTVNQNTYVFDPNIGVFIFSQNILGTPNLMRLPDFFDDLWATYSLTSANVGEVI
jgi:hypothetical protein